MPTGTETGWMWIAGLTVLAIGILTGVVIGHLALGDRRKSKELQTRLDALQQEFDQYRGKVSAHFMQTSELVQKMTDSYREVYEHLATGSQELCETPVDTPRLDFADRPTLEAAPDTATEPEAEAPGTDAGPAAQIEEDEVLGDSPKVPDLELEMPAPKAADKNG